VPLGSGSGCSNSDLPDPAENGPEDTVPYGSVPDLRYRTGTGTGTSEPCCTPSEVDPVTLGLHKRC